jgi:hypothetical protein
MVRDRKNWYGMDAAALRRWASSYREQAECARDLRLAATLADLAGALDYAATLIDRGRPVN